MDLMQGQNQLDGGLPTSISGMTKLITFRATSNKLTGKQNCAPVADVACTALGIIKLLNVQAHYLLIGTRHQL